ncbi:MAG: GNAT family N-acetyltransferase [Nitriliruptoraceae bacterium]|nr:GNAT family N-acetyltransferase [Nitriliruptoraceae bacterium]
MPPRLTIRPLAPEDETEAGRAHAELEAEGFSFLLHRDTTTAFDDYVTGLHRWERGEAIPDGFVRASFRVAALAAAIEDPPSPAGTIVGRISIRHELNDWLRRRGGHIGFGVRPRYRERGIAGQMLAAGLQTLRAEGLPRALVTADEDNHTSRWVIERAGGVLENVDTSEPGLAVARYWIDLGAG